MPTLLMRLIRRHFVPVPTQGSRTRAQEDDADIEGEQIRVLFRQTPIALAVNLSVAGILAYVIAPVVKGSNLALWLGVMFVILCMRYTVCVWQRRAGRVQIPLRIWQWLSRIGSGITGALWGFGGALMLPHGSTYQVFVGFTIGGMCAGAVVIHASDFPTLMAFLLMAALPVAARFLLEGSLTHVALGAMMLIFTGALSLAGFNLNRSLVETFGLRIELARRARELEAANSRLIEESRERRAAQEMLFHAEKMDALGRLTGGLAHDFNNLLTIIVGNLSLLRRRVVDVHEMKFIDAAYDGTMRAATLTHSLLSFARHNKFALEVENLNQLIENFGGLLRDSIGENATLTMNLSPDLASCRIDKTHFHTALLNLVTNACQALPAAGGRITIETQNATLNEQEAAAYPELRPGPYVGLAVTDNGAGMPPEVQARAFEPFFTTKPEGKGTGLGLSQVFGFVRQSGGSVRIISKPDQGTSVRILLPQVIGEPRIEEKGSTARSASDHSKRMACVLVVEDEPQVRAITAETLAELGYDVIEAADGPSALAQLETGRHIDVLLSDIVMPNAIRGDELAKRAIRLRPKLKVLLMSAYIADDVERPAEFPFLRKPFESQELAAALDELTAAAL